MYKEHPIFKRPKNKNEEIWRYMDLSKFINLLDRKELFFPRADNLGDPFEGSYPKANIHLRKAAAENDLLRKMLGDNLDWLIEMSKFHERMREYTAISCWHQSDYESAAMWRLYLKSDEGIAIKSTFGRLKSSFGRECRDIYIGKVKYIDYNKDLMPPDNFLYPFLFKRKSFKYERELRAVIFEFPKEPPFTPLFSDGTPVSVDLDMLIDEVRLAPTCLEWVHGVVESVIEKYGLNKNLLHQSDLNVEPLF